MKQLKGQGFISCIQSVLPTLILFLTTLFFGCNQKSNTAEYQIAKETISKEITLSDSSSASEIIDEVSATEGNEQPVTDTMSMVQEMELEMVEASPPPKSMAKPAPMVPKVELPKASSPPKSAGPPSPDKNYAVVKVFFCH